MASVEALTGKMDTSRRRPLSEVAKGFVRFATGDVIFAKITPCMENGKIAVVPELPCGIGYGSTEFHVIRPRQGISSEYVFYFVLQEWFRGDARRHMTGAVGQQRVPADYVRKVRIPVAPEAEQRRIVARIEELFGEIEAGKQELEKAREGLAAYRRSILKAAVTGELTREWREKNAPNETGADLLARILTERRDGIEASGKSGLAGKRRSARSGRNSGANEIGDPVPSLLAPLPRAWCWAFGAQIFLWSSGENLTAKQMRGGPYPVYGGNGVSGHHNQRIVERPTLVVGRVGAHCGNVHLTTGPAWITDNAIYATYAPEGVSLEYLKLVLSAARLNQRAAGSGQPFVNQTILNTTPIPLPPLAEQREICAIVEELLSSAFDVETALGAQQKEIQGLRQSILAAGFSGKLTSQDPADEPASVLLERLRTENAQALNLRRSRTTRTERPKLSQAQRRGGSRRLQGELL